ncbi:GNAT family N-acetyltransferase [Pseudalkalibacillus caeni]|uniref:GNAT family N-acetyltransferase n=1 Tax=Exobacillus caeni TaxID=2574798 RepID=A0A5R9FC50_9BACL|nr:GNAT family protein [Pseudalkalibacillus caeni]TLS37225.1 GNAT family N-acetyltransferase [Pseudalkalibacillus caeni]
MDYTFKHMTQKQAEDIAYNWHYDGEYSFYDITADEEDLEEFLDPDQRGDSTFAVFKNNELEGFFSFKETEQGVVDIGLGMHPDLTGKGNGLSFLKAGIDFAKKKYAPHTFTLAVATFNQRAIKVYEKAGFQPEGNFMQATNGSEYEFLKMRFVAG